MTRLRLLAACAILAAALAAFFLRVSRDMRDFHVGRFDVKFYLPAILFIVFDVEVVFLYPWAVMFRRLGMFGFVEMAVFIAVLTLGLVYVWRKGALEWT